ncbi:efflux RND transporter periplasmic adaptor subunit [Xanthovirga aplysinae]|uniref:efflux RND transporter periplasmic adaptor subunit n=1 Tax=Xanthovirga aplysinae TaxID=2529853 RepID=UPI0012BC123D|nr:efflux RND transporter periplasmic adaptor subunit [Xanthovirga aplysinae]MTI31259.1 efflux RND transporter periplasmic adaptor subunit [Xanthovirga aplysinae]
MKTIKSFLHIPGIFLMVISTMLLSCSGKKENKQEEHHAHEEEETRIILSKTQQENSGIVLGKLEEKNISEALKVNGKIDVPPQSMANVSIPFGGFLKSTFLLAGQRVKKGEVLAFMEHPDYIQLQQDYLVAKSERDFLKKELDRQKVLARKNITAEKKLQKVQADYEAIKAKTEGFAAKMRMLNINQKALDKNGKIVSSIPVVSPINGFVAESHAKVGAFYNPTDVLFYLVNPEELHLELFVYEKDIPKTFIGQEVRFRLPSDPNIRHAEVTLISEQVDEHRTITVHSELTEDNTGLKPGMYVDATIITGRDTTAALPEDAVIRFDGGNYVFAKVPAPKGQFAYEMIPVERGASQDDYTAVKLPSNVKANTQLVVKGGYTLLSLLKNGEDEGHSH